LLQWNPSTLEETCLGCGICGTGCGRLVHRFDFDYKKPMVDPLNGMVGCTTCADTCPSHVIAVPSIESVLALEGLAAGAPRGRGRLADTARFLAAPAAATLPHPARIVTLTATTITHATADVLQVNLSSMTPGACFCEFTAGQYIALWQSDSMHLSRSCSIVNAPSDARRARRSSTAPTQ
jgi:CDP-4-dehydro-6-deoxyglucose reductase